MTGYSLTSLTKSFVESEFLGTICEEDRDDMTPDAIDTKISRLLQQSCYLSRISGFVEIVWSIAKLEVDGGRIESAGPIVRSPRLADLIADLPIM